MTSLFPELRSELVGAMERGPRRRRAPMVAVAVLVAAAVAVGVARIDRPARPAATPMPTPVDIGSLPPSIQRTLSNRAGAHPFGRKPGAPIVVLRLSDGDVAWTSVVYLSRSGMISATVAPDRLHQEYAGVAGRSAFAYAAASRPSVDIGLAGVRAGGTRHYLVTGTVDASVRAVTITVGGRRVETQLSRDSLTVPVEIPRSGLTPEGRRQVKRMPKRISLRLYAGTLSGPLEHGPLGTVRPSADLTLADGTHRTVEGAHMCVTRRCGTVTQSLD
jgi:hypothetical protein